MVRGWRRCNSAKDPGDLADAGRESPGTGAGRPRAVALAGAGLPEEQRLLGHRHEQRALEAEGDRATGPEVFNRLDEVDDLNTVAMPLDSLVIGLAACPAELLIRHRAMSAQ